MNPVLKIEVRCIHEKNRPRLQTTERPFLYVQSPTDWRALCVRGTVFTVAARMRADGECWVMQGGIK